jgi:hypothetical protein
MICPRCGSQMKTLPNDVPVCVPCVAEAAASLPPRVRPAPPQGNLGPLPESAFHAERLRKLEDRMARLESWMADEKRRRMPKKAQFLGETAEEPSPGEPGEKG